MVGIPYTDGPLDLTTHPLAAHIQVINMTGEGAKKERGFMGRAGR